MYCNLAILGGGLTGLTKMHHTSLLCRVLLCTVMLSVKCNKKGGDCLCTIWDLCLDMESFSCT